MRKLISLLAVVSWLLICASLPIKAAQRTKATNARVKVFVDNECPLPTIPAIPRLRRLAKRMLQHEKYGMHGDVAFPYDLNGDAKPEYVVMLNCSAVGNCNWGVFSIRPVKLLGEIYGKDLLFRERKGPWTAITTYGHLSASWGALTTFCYRNGHYRQCTKQQEVSVERGNIPNYLRKRPVNCPK